MFDHGNLDDNRFFGMVMMVIVNILIANPLVSSAFIAVFAAMRTNTLLKWKDFFSAFHCPYYFALLPLVVMLSMGKFIGFHLFILPGIFFTLVTAFALPLHGEHRFLTSWKAIRASYKVLKHYFWSFLCFIILLGLLNVLGMFFFGIGLLITAPVSFYALCYCYNHLVGVNGVALLVPATFTPLIAVPATAPQASNNNNNYRPQQPTSGHQMPNQGFTQNTLPPVATPVSFASQVQPHLSYPQSPSLQSPSASYPQSPSSFTSPQYRQSDNLYTATSIPPSSVNFYPAQL